MTDHFLEALIVRDFNRLESTFAPDIRARLLLPGELIELTGPKAVAREVESWFGSAAEFVLESSSNERVGGRHRVNWRFSVRRGGPREVIEQLAFMDVGADGIEMIDLVCSGFQVYPGDAEGAAHIFDAGAMGCADGLAQEFRRQLSAVAVGDSIRVVVRDPAAKEDLPALARMLGQAVTSVEAHEDGRLTINVEKIK